MNGDIYLIGIDIGTGSVKAALFGEDGSIYGFGQHEYSFLHPNPKWSELSPQIVWERLALAIRGCLRQADINSLHIAGIGISSIGDTGMALDGYGRPLYPAIECVDQRSEAYAAYVKQFDKLVGRERIYKKTGYPLSPLPPVHKILWLRDNLPDVYMKMDRYGSFQEFLLWKMTGNAYVDYSLASRTMAFDIVEKRWLKEFLDPLGIPAGFFSEAVPSSKVAGFLKEDAASQLGLPADLPVVTGAHDQCCSAIGMGIMDSDLAGDGTGSMEALLRMTGNPSLSIAAGEKGISCQCHAISGKYLLLSFQLTAGSLIRWYRDQLGGLEKLAAAQSDADAYDIITGGAAKSSPGAGGLLLLPHFLGSGTGRVPPLDARSRGALLGLSLTHTRQDIARAMFEGITYETRFLLEGLEEGGERIDALVVTGGAAKSPFWLQLKADITGKRILVPQITEASCLGAAVLAGIGTGLYCSWDEAITKACHIRETNVPDSKARSIYDRQYSIYKGIYCTLLSLHSQLVDASLNGQE